MSTSQPSLLDQIIDARKGLLDKEYEDIVVLINKTIGVIQKQLSQNLDITTAWGGLQVEHLSHTAIDYAVANFKLPGLTVERHGLRDNKFLRVKLTVSTETS